MDPQKIIRKYYDPNSEAYRVLVTHSELVMQKALALAQRVGPDATPLRLPRSPP